MTEDAGPSPHQGPDEPPHELHSTRPRHEYGEIRTAQGQESVNYQLFLSSDSSVHGADSVSPRNAAARPHRSPRTPRARAQRAQRRPRAPAPPLPRAPRADRWGCPEPDKHGRESPGKVPSSISQMVLLQAEGRWATPSLPTGSAFGAHEFKNLLHAASLVFLIYLQ